MKYISINKYKKYRYVYGSICQKHCTVKSMKNFIHDKNKNKE